MNKFSHYLRNTVINYLQIILEVKSRVIWLKISLFFKF